MKVAAAMDSVHVHTGLQGNALIWQAKHRTTPQGPVINLDLWVEILGLLETSAIVFLWVKVPSHVDIAGNDRADQLRADSPPPCISLSSIRCPPPPPPCMEPETG